MLAKWLDTEPEVPEGQWYKRFSGMTVCGDGELIKTFLLPGQSAKGGRVHERIEEDALVEPLVVELAAGDALFIPRGWWCHVRSLRRSVGVSHWWSMPRPERR